MPTYRQIMDQIKFQIASGVLAANAELPSTRALCAELSVNQMTVSKAYNLLERENILERRPGQTLVVKAKDEKGLSDQKLDQFRQSLAPAVSAAHQLGIGAPEALRTFRDMLNHSHTRP
ncbi:MAG TPA: GntR family transcriptional regulator [Opitutaceae bacterium]